MKNVEIWPGDADLREYLGSIHIEIGIEKSSEFWGIQIRILKIWKIQF